MGAVSLLGTVPLLTALAQHGTTTTGEITEDFNQSVVQKPDRVIAADGFHQGDQGWYLDAGATGRFVYRIPGQPGTAIGVNLWVYSRGGVTNTVSVSAPGLPQLQVASNIESSGDRLAIPAQYARGTSLDVEIDATNSGPVEQLVVDQLVTYNVSGTDPRAPPAYSYVAFGLLIGVLTFLLLRRREKAHLVAIGVGATAAAAAASRITGLVLAHMPLDPDAVAYKIYGEQFQWWPLFDHGLFSGNFVEREPLYPMVLHLAFELFGESDFRMRVVSTTLSIAVVIVSVFAARRRLHTWWAPGLVGLGVASSGPLIAESYRGLRLELETLGVLALYLALDRPPSRRPVLDAAGVGLIGAAMALTRTYLIPVFVLAVIVSFLIRYRPRPRVIALLAIAMLIMGGAEAGHRIGMYEHHQNFFWDTGGYLRWDANQELFRYHRPLPHPELFPSLREYQAEGTYAGTRPTTYQYFFEIHSPLEFARDSLAGAAEIFDTMDSFSVDVGELTRVRHVPDSVVSLGNAVALRIDLVVRWMVLLGLMGMVVRARRHPLFLLAPVMIVSWLGTTAFLFDHGLIERYRHTWQVYPLALIAGVWLLETCYVVLRHYVPWQRLLRVDWLLITAVLLLAIVERSAPGSTQLVAAVLLAAGVDVLSYRRPGWGIGVMLVAMSTDSTVVGAGVSLTCLGGILAKLRPELRMQAWLVALLPLAAAIVLGAERPSAESIEIAVAMVASAGAVAVAARQDRVRQELLMVLAATGPLAGITYFLEPLAPSAVMLTAVGAVAATWLYLDGRRWALPFGLLDLALVIVIEPFAAWLGVAAALVWLAFNSGRFKLLRRRVSIAGGLAIAFAVLTAGASLAGTTAPAASAWTMRMTTSTSTVEQLITVDRPGDTSIWIYARRASALTDYPFTLTVNGNEVTSDLNSYLLTDPMAWVRVPLPRSPRVGDRLDVKVAAGGAPDAVDRYIEVGGVYAAVNGITSPGVNGTFLIVLGDDSLPLAPGGLPEPLVRNRLQPPMGDWMPGEVRGELDSREQAGTLQIWQETLKIATAHPLGTGTGTLSNYLLGSRAGLGPGLTARSAYLQAVAEWGFAGLAGLLIAVGAAAWFVLRSRDPLAAALLILAVIAMAGESILSDQAGALTVWIGLGFCFGSIGSRAAFPSTSRASGDETRTTTSPPEASHAG